MTNYTMVLDNTTHSDIPEDLEFEHTFRYVMGKLHLYGIPVLVAVGVVTNLLR